MKNIIKKISWFSLIAFLAIPLGLTLSCAKNNNRGNSKTKKTGFKFPKIEGAQAIAFDNVDLSEIKAAAIAKGITKKQIDSITLEDLQKSRLKDSSLSNEKRSLINKVAKIVIDFSFEKNNDKTQMTELQKWINNASLAVYNSQDPERGPWLSKKSEGFASYYRNDLINLRTIANIGGHDLLGSDFVEGANFNPKRMMKIFDKINIVKKGERVFDNSFQIQNTFSSPRKSGVSFSLYRTSAKGKYDYDVNPKNGEKKWTSVEKETANLFGGVDIKINDKVPKDRTFQEAIKASKSEGKKTTITFTTSNEAVKYGKSENGVAINSNVLFKAKDLFYGFVRNLYACKDIRNKGTIKDVDVSDFLESFTEKEKKEWISYFNNKAAADVFNNDNVYLFDLYGLDIYETIKANMANTQDEDKFIIKFKNFAPISLSIFKDLSIMGAFSGTLMKPNANQESKKINQKQLSVMSYGNPYSGTGTINPNGILSLAPFIYTKYSTSVNEETTIEQNPSYFNQDWVNNSNSIKGYITVGISPIMDSSSFAQTRLNQFKKASISQEYELYKEVLSISSLLDDISNYKVYKKTLRKQESPNSSLSWNFYGFNEKLTENKKTFNGLGKKMIWGFDENIETNPLALKNFFYGVGSKTRASISAAINWYAMAQTLFPNQHKEFYPSVAQDDEFDISNVDRKYITPSYMNTTDEMKEIYESNLKDRYKAWTPSTVAEAAKTLDQIATSVGATKENPATIGIFKHIFTDVPPSNQKIATNKLILERLNKLTPKVKFTNQREVSKGDYIKFSKSKKTAATHFQGYGPDYVGLGSINEQYLRSYCTYGSIALIKNAFDN